MKGFLAIVLASIIAAACGCRERPGQADAPPGGTGAPGACDNFAAAKGSECHRPNLILQHCPECGASKKRFSLGLMVKGTDPEQGFLYGTVTIPAGRERDLQEFLLRTLPAKCEGFIIHPPCNPTGTSVDLDISWPDWITVNRGM
jgi:hypothetical protein